MYMIYHDSRVYHGGTIKGCKFLEENCDVSRRFSSAVHTESVCFLTHTNVSFLFGDFCSYISYLVMYMCNNIL